MMKYTIAAIATLGSLLVLRRGAAQKALAPVQSNAEPRHLSRTGWRAGATDPTLQAAQSDPAAGAVTTCVVGLRGIPDVPGGIETHCEHLYPRLAALRPTERFVVVGRRPAIGPDERLCGENLRVVPLMAARHRYFETLSNSLLGVLAARGRLGARMVHLHGVGPGLFAPLARVLGPRVVLTHHGDDFRHAKWNRLARAVLKLGERAGVGSAHRVIAVSASLAARLRTEYPRRAEHIRYIPNGADHILASARTATRGNAEWRESFGLDGVDYILSVGRLVPEKGFADLIEAYARTHLPARLVIAGGKAGSDHDTELFARIARLGLQGQVIMTGSLPHEGVVHLIWVGAGEDLWFEHLRLRNAVSARGAMARGSSYVQGDDVVLEADTRNARFSNCHAEEMGDAGFDLKCDGVEMSDCSTRNCKYGVRIWRGGAENRLSRLSLSAPRAWAENAGACLWMGGRAVLSDCLLRGGPDSAVIRFGKGLDGQTPGLRMTGGAVETAGGSFLTGDPGEVILREVRVDGRRITGRALWDGREIRFA